ncbi:unnamed protein product [Rhodiola kirilowii]
MEEEEAANLDYGDALSPISSRYSSCGESEFDRYCSANSAMATPSVCGSSFRAFSDCNDSDFASLRSFGFGGDDLSLDCLSLSGRFERGNEVRKLSDCGVVSGSGEIDVIRDGPKIEDDCRDRDEFCSRVRNDAEDGSGAVPEIVVNTVGDYVEVSDSKEGGLSEEEEEASSRGEYSGGEDSGFEDGLIREVKIDSRNWHVQQKGEKGESWNPLVMGSSEAYGADDWDDFVEHNGEDFLTNMPPNYLYQGNLNVTESRNNPPETLYQSEDANDGIKIHETEADIPRLNCSAHDPDTQSGLSDVFRKTIESEQGDMAVRDIHLVSCQPQEIEDEKQDPDECGGLIKESQDFVDEKVIEIQKNYMPESQLESKVSLDPLSDSKINQMHSHFIHTPEEIKSNHVGDHKSELSTLISMDDRSLNHPFVSASMHEDSIKPIKMDSPELNESLDDFVTEMEEILLDAVGSPGLRYNQSSNIFQSQLSLPSRASLSAASTSDLDTADPSIHHVQRIDGVEVVGALQKNGDVSLSERLVGVKEYTVYKIRVWSGNDRWEVERRYRDFCTLYRRLKAQYADRNLTLPSPWSSVERESRKIFGNASPDVVAERSILIQECLTSILNSRISSSSPGALIWFLSPKDSFMSSPKAVSSGTPTSSRDNNIENVRSLGKTISLIVENKRVKSVKQQLEAQHYKCAGCHQYFDEGKTVMLEIIHTLGWGKPRLCEYTGQLFCHSCHTNDTSVLPARVLHQWDFTKYPVSQMAKSYLDSIHDQPMLCVSAVNPFLLSKVPALLQVMNIRKKIGAMLPYLRCPFRRTINKGLRSRRYLLDSNDFFSLRDLMDLSRGPFSALPVTVETISRKILEHITEQCLFCCDVGVVCGAKQACRDPMSLIFPFQEGEVKKCRSCGMVFHEPCFKKLTNCPCEAHLRLDKAPGSAHKVGGGSNSDAGALDIVGKKLALSISETISGLFSTTTRQSSDNNVILMGSMPSDSI